MAREFNIAGYEDYPLDDDALDAAINQAEEAVRAGYDEQQQLIDGIRAYCFVRQQLDGPPLVPASLEQAKTMIRAAERFIHQHGEDY